MLAGVKHRFGRISCLPGIPWYFSGMSARLKTGWETRGRAQAREGIVGGKENNSDYDVRQGPGLGQARPARSGTLLEG